MERRILSTAEFNLLQARLVDELAKRSRSRQKVFRSKKGSRTRQYDSPEPARLQPPRWVKCEQTPQTCKTCRSPIDWGEECIEVQVLAPGASTPSNLGRFCTEACLIRFCWTDTPDDVQKRLSAVDQEEQAEIAKIRKRFAETRNEAGRPKILFCYVCRSVIPVESDKSLSAYRRCPTCLANDRTTAEDRYCHTCGKTFKAQLNKNVRPINCPEHEFQPPDMAELILPTHNGQAAHVKRTESGFEGKVEGLREKLTWDLEGRVVGIQEGFNLILGAQPIT
jgi:hypothetical protein